MKYQTCIWITLLTILLIIFQGCDQLKGQKGDSGSPGQNGIDGVDGENGQDFEVVEGPEGAVLCLERSLPDFYVDKFYYSRHGHRIYIKLKELK